MVTKAHGNFFPPQSILRFIIRNSGRNSNLYANCGTHQNTGKNTHTCTESRYTHG